MLASSVQAVVACNATALRVCNLALFIIEVTSVSLKCYSYTYSIAQKVCSTNTANKRLFDKVRQFLIIAGGERLMVNENYFERRH